MYNCCKLNFFWKFFKPTCSTAADRSTYICSATGTKHSSKKKNDNVLHTSVCACEAWRNNWWEKKKDKSCIVTRSWPIESQVGWRGASPSKIKMTNEQTNDHSENKRYDADDGPNTFGSRSSLSKRVKTLARLVRFWNEPNRTRHELS